MKASKTINMDVSVWSELGKVAEDDFDGDVSAAVEKICKMGLVVNEPGEAG